MRFPDTTPLRRLALTGIPWAALAFAAPAWSSGTEPFADLLDASLKDRKGIVVYVKGQAIGGRVTRLSSEAVELTSREYSRIIVRCEAIDGVAGN